MTAAEMLDWEVLEEVDPFGQKRLDHHFAKLRQLLAHGLGIGRKDGRAWEYADFLPPYPLRPEVLPPVVPKVLPEKPPQTADYIEAVCRLWVRGHNQMLKEEKARR